MGAPARDESWPRTGVGYYTYLVADDQWSWSDGIYDLHGYIPHAVPATTEVLLRHKHPDDLARAFEVLEKAVTDGQPFRCHHRIIDCDGRVRSVLLVGRGVRDATGRVEQLVGFFVDLTDLTGLGRAGTGTDVVDARLAPLDGARSLT